MAKDVVADTLAGTILKLARNVEALLHRQQCSDPPSRILVALAGVPGSGKSTVSQALLLELASRGIDHVAVVPMVRRLLLFPLSLFRAIIIDQIAQDGFHYTKETLSTFEDAENAFRRRGAPFTFDAASFLALVEEIKSLPVDGPGEAEQFLYAPSFDHAIQDPVANGIPISSRTRLIIIEGNYTLLDVDPWRKVAALCQEKWFVDTPRDVVLDRLVQRHLVAGIETNVQKAIERVKENDLVNGDLIKNYLIKPDIVLEN